MKMSKSGHLLNSPEKQSKAVSDWDDTPPSKSKSKKFSDDSFLNLQQAPIKKNHLGLKMHCNDNQFIECELVENDKSHNKNWIFFSDSEDEESGKQEAPVPLLVQKDISPEDLQLRSKRPSSLDSNVDPILGPDESDDIL